MQKAAQHISKVSTVQKQQSFLGNKKDPAFFAPALIQPKLAIGPENDLYETEADTIADKIMRMTSTDTLQIKPSPITIKRKCEACEAEEKLQRKEADEPEHLQIKELRGNTVQRQCTACEEEEAVHRKEDDTAGGVRLKPVNVSAIQRQCPAFEHEEQKICRKDSGTYAVPGVTPAVQQSLNSQGRPLEPGAKSFMESRFGYDFGDVQIHNDSLAHKSSKDIKARAYTNGMHIVFGEGQYQPETYAGRQLLAHELTHVLQQNGTLSRTVADDIIQREFIADPVFYTEDWESNPYDDIVEIDIKGQKTLQLQDDDTDYLLYHFFGGGEAPIKIKYGDKAVGIIYIKCTIADIDIVCGINYLKYLVPLARLLPENCYPEFNAAASFYSAKNQVIPIELDKLDTSPKQGSLVLNVEIENNKISGRVGWLPGIDKKAVDPVLGYESADFSNSALLAFIYGNDYKGDNFKEDYYSNILKDGWLNILSLGELFVPNLQKIQGIFQTGDGDKIWNAHLVTNIMGAEEHQLPIGRTEQGLLSGNDDSITIGAEWAGRHFKADTSLHTSFINSNLSVVGKIHYQSERGEGDLFLAVTDYLTAKKYAVEYLPDQIKNIAAADKPPANPDNRLAFVGAGNISLVLFDGERTTYSPPKPGKGDMEGKGGLAPKLKVKADAGFVVEPEGYITVAGEISQPVGKFMLFDRAEYAKDLDLFKIPVISIPGPYGSRFEVDFGANLIFGAHIGPLTLSQLKVAGIYSNRPKANSELELSGLVQLDGEVFADLVLSLGLKGCWGPFCLEIVSKEIKFGATMHGSIYARPTITIRNPNANDEKPPEYSIAGNFDFDVGGGLSYQIKDRMKANANEKKPKDPAAPETYKYVEGKADRKRKVPEGDIKIPLDESLGTGVPPPAISAEKLESLGFGTTLNNVMNGRAPGEKYFEKGVSDAYKQPKDTETTIKEGGYREHGQRRGQIEDTPKSTVLGADAPENPTYTFEQDFYMKSAAHKLYLLVEMVRDGDTISNVAVNLLMASEVAEDIEQKIEREQAQVLALQPGPEKDFQEKDLEMVLAEVKEIENDVKEKAQHNQLSENAITPQLAPLAAGIGQYAERTNEIDLGAKPPLHLVPATPAAPATPPTPAPAAPAAPAVPPTPVAPVTPVTKICREPKDVKEGDDIVFIGPHNEDLENGVVQQIYVHEGDMKKDNWLIRFKPKTGRITTSLSKRAYDENCEPTYRVPLKPGAFKTHIVPDPIAAPTRYVGGKSYYSFKKANTIEAFPLRWGTYLDPDVPIVGMDRINTLRAGKWHRTHLVDGDLGGPGRFDNLVPASQYVNTVKMTKHEDHLEGLVKRGDLEISKVYYWFKAVVNYYDDSDNYDVKYYSDFVKSVDVSYGIAEPKDKSKPIDDLTDDEWDRTSRDKYKRTVVFDDEPETLDIKSTRTEG